MYLLAAVAVAGLSGCLGDGTPGLPIEGPTLPVVPLATSLSAGDVRLTFPPAPSSGAILLDIHPDDWVEAAGDLAGGSDLLISGTVRDVGKENWGSFLVFEVLPDGLRLIDVDNDRGAYDFVWDLGYARCATRAVKLLVVAGIEGDSQNATLTLGLPGAPTGKPIDSSWGVVAPDAIVRFYQETSDAAQRITHQFDVKDSRQHLPTPWAEAYAGSLQLSASDPGEKFHFFLADLIGGAIPGDGTWAYEGGIGQGAVAKSGRYSVVADWTHVAHVGSGAGATFKFEVAPTGDNGGTWFIRAGHFTLDLAALGIPTTPRLETDSGPNGITMTDAREMAAVC